MLATATGYTYLETFTVTVMDWLTLPDVAVAVMVTGPAPTAELCMQPPSVRSRKSNPTGRQ